MCTELASTFLPALSCLAEPSGCTQTFCCGVQTDRVGLILADPSGTRAVLERLETSHVIFNSELDPGWFDCSTGDVVLSLHEPPRRNRDPPGGPHDHNHDTTTTMAGYIRPGGAWSLCTSIPFGSAAGDEGLSFFIRGNVATARALLVLSNHDGRGGPGEEGEGEGESRGDRVVGDDDSVSIPMTPSSSEDVVASLSLSTTYARRLGDLAVLSEPNHGRPPDNPDQPTTSTSTWTHVYLPFARLPQPSEGFTRLSFLNQDHPVPMSFLLDDVQLVRRRRSREGVDLREVRTVAVFRDELASGWRDCSANEEGSNAAFYVRPPWHAVAHAGDSSIGATLDHRGYLGLCTSEAFGTGVGDAALSFWIRSVRNFPSLRYHNHFHDHFHDQRNIYHTYLIPPTHTYLPICRTIYLGAYP